MTPGAASRACARAVRSARRRHAALHEAGLLHRDLKPENVFLPNDGGAKLLDFGIAKDISAPSSTTTQAGVARGTPATMAPERFFGAPASESSDVYELALLLYAMLVGHLPWADTTDASVRLDPVSPIDAGAGVSKKLSVEIMRALSTRPERRPPRASRARGTDPRRPSGCRCSGARHLDHVRAPTGDARCPRVRG